MQVPHRATSIRARSLREVRRGLSEIRVSLTNDGSRMVCICVLERRSCMEVARKTYLLLDSCSNIICEHIAWLRAGITSLLVANLNIPFFLIDTVVTPVSVRIALNLHWVYYLPIISISTSDAQSYVNKKKDEHQSFNQ